MKRRIFISVSLVLAASTVSPSLVSATDPVAICESGTCLYLRFDNTDLTLPPTEHTHFEVTFNGSVPSVDLLKGRTGQNNTGTLYQWRVWCKDTQGNPADIGEIMGVEDFDYDLKILNASGGSGAATVGAITLYPGQPENVTYYSNLSGGDIGSLTGNLTVKPTQHTIWPIPNGQITGNLSIGTVGSESVIEIRGGVQGGARLTITTMNDGATAIIGAVEGAGVLPAGHLSIAHVGAGHGNPFGPDNSGFLQLSNVNESSGVITLGELHPGAIVYVDCENTCLVERAVCCAASADTAETTQITIGQMDGSTPTLAGAYLQHRGVLGFNTTTLQYETLTIGPMGPGAKVSCGFVRGTLNLPAGIGQGAIIELGSIGYIYPALSTAPGHGVVDLMGRDSEGHATGPQNVAGTLQVDGGIAGQIINGGNVTATGQVKLVKNDGTFAGQATFANVSGSVHVGDPDVNHLTIANVSGTLDVADVSGTVVVTGNVASSGSVQVGSVTSGGSVQVANVSGTLSVGGNVASGGTLAVDNVSGSGTMGVHVQGSVSGALEAADVSGTVSVAGSVTTGGTVTVDDVTGALSVAGSLAGGLTVGGALAGSVDVGSDMSGYLTAEANTSGHIHIGGDQSGPVTIKGTLAQGASVAVDGGLKGTAIINVTGTDSGTINVGKGMASATKIQAQGGLSTGSSINVHAADASA